MRKILAVVAYLGLAGAACKHAGRAQPPARADARAAPPAGDQTASSGGSGAGSGSQGSQVAAAANADGGMQSMHPADPDLVMRGSYLAKAYGCAVCHTAVGNNGADFSRAYAGRAVGDLLGNWTSPNLTPDATGLGSWSDDQIVAAIREGQGPAGTRLDPIMPSAAYAGMTNSDVRSIVAFLRSLPPVSNRVSRAPHPATSATRPSVAVTMANVDTTRGIAVAAGSNTRALIDAGTQQAALAPGPIDPVDDPIKHGAYLVAMMGCSSCHGASDNTNAQNQSPSLAGGREIVMPLAGSGVVYASNITSDKATGIGAWTPGQIESALRTLTRPDGSHISGPMMFYVPYWSTLDERDLSAVAAYLKTVPAVQRKVPKSTFVAFATTTMPGMVGGGLETPLNGGRVGQDNNGTTGDAGVMIPARLATPSAGGTQSLTGGGPAYGGGGAPNAGSGGGATNTPSSQIGTTVSANGSVSPSGTPSTSGGSNTSTGSGGGPSVSNTYGVQKTGNGASTSQTNPNSQSGNQPTAVGQPTAAGQTTNNSAGTSSSVQNGQGASGAAGAANGGNGGGGAQGGGAGGGK